MGDASLLCAIRGPLMLITLGALIQFDYTGGIAFRKSWPVLIIVYAVLKLAEAVVARQAPPPANPFQSQFPPATGGPQS